MTKKVWEQYTELYHYTTAAGLKGIVESQQLRATHIAYLNDGEEHTGFFDRRLPSLLETVMRAVAEEIQDPVEQERFEAAGGIEQALRDARRLAQTIKATTLRFNSPYVSCFCATSAEQDPNDG